MAAEPELSSKVPVFMLPIIDRAEVLHAAESGLAAEGKHPAIKSRVNRSVRSLVLTMVRILNKKLLTSNLCER